VPRDIAGQWQYIDLFPDWDRGVARLVEAVETAAQGRTPPVLVA